MNDTEIKRKGIDRLHNWARWAGGGEVGMIMRHYYPSSAMVCGQYNRRSPEEDSDDPPVPVDEQDAMRVERFINALDDHHKALVRHHYFGRPRVIRVPDSVIHAAVDYVARQLGR